MFTSTASLTETLSHLSTGEHSQQNLELLAKRGYTVVDWSFDAEDAVGASPEDSIESYKQLAKNFPASQITLNHETYQTTAQKVTPNAVSALQNAGYKLVHVSECLGLGIETKDLYLSVGTPSARDVRNNFPSPDVEKHLN
jgi:hypothetical protein